MAHEEQWAAQRKEYRAYLKLEKGLSVNTLEAYMRDVDQLVDFLQAEFSIVASQAQASHIENYMAHLYDRGAAKRSQARQLSGVKSFYTFLLYTGVIESLPTEFIDSPKIGRSLPDTLTVEEIERILTSIDLSLPQGERNRAMLEMLYSCGLRVTELVDLRLPDLFLQEGFARVIGKGNKQRLVPMGDEARCRIEHYLAARAHIVPKAGCAEVVFLNRRGGKLSRVMVFNIMKEAAIKAGITKSVSPHTFRHSFATHLLQGGANIRQIQEMLGHSSIITTEIYTHLERGHLKRSLQEHHPLK